ncbi:hypothetical protein ILYODFUR_038386, partial [Ilyodon furcidens]
EAVTHVGGFIPAFHLPRTQFCKKTPTGIMGSPLKSLVHDDERYQKSFHLFLERSSEHQCMRDFIHNKLPDILS